MRLACQVDRFAAQKCYHTTAANAVPAHGALHVRRAAHRTSFDVFHTRSRSWLQASEEQDEQLWAPAILVSEVAAALSRGQSDPMLALKAVRRLRASRRLRLVAVSTSLAFSAAQVAAQQRMRGCDALYVALAQRLGETLVTLDRQQLERGAVLIETRQP